MKLFTNTPIKGRGQIWSAKNGATRRNLCLIVNDKEFTEPLPETDVLEGVKLGYLDKGNHSFIFINKGNTDGKIGIFLNRAYGYTNRAPETTIFENCSTGGYGNSESKFGIYRVGALLEVDTYKNRQPSEFYILTENGWKNLGDKAEILSNHNPIHQRIVNIMGWNDEIKEVTI